MPADEGEARKIAQETEDCWHNGDSGQAIASWGSLAELTGNDLLADYADRIRSEFEDEQLHTAQELISLARQLTSPEDGATTG